MGGTLFVPIFGTLLHSRRHTQGNIIETGYHLPGGTRTFWQRFDYQYPNRPGKLWKTINPDDSFTEYGYDAMGGGPQKLDNVLSYESDQI